MVMVPVPRYLVTDVYRFIVTEEERRRTATNGDRGESSMQPVDIDGKRDPASLRQQEGWRYIHLWSEEDLTDTLENGTRALRVILPYLAKHPDQRVKGQALAEVVYGPGAKMQQLGGALGSFSKTAYKRYGRHKWPFEAVRNDEERAWEYVMYEDTAEVVRGLIGE